MGAPASIHLNSTTAAQVVQEFDGPGGSGNKVPPVGPLNFVSDTPAVATIDPLTGKITPLTVGTVTFTVKDMGALDASGNPLQDSNLVTVAAGTAQSLVSSITP